MVKTKSNFKTNAPLVKNPKAQYLVIVESPSKCSKIESFLGPLYQCIASKGHLCTIPGLKNIRQPHYEIDYEILNNKKTHVEQMQRIISSFSPNRIYLASDDDREGEAIAQHIQTLFQLPLTTHRIVFHEITQTAVLHAIQNPRTINMNTVWSQRARQVMDIMVGFRVSPILWKFIHSDPNSPLSAGRCQSVALRLVYEKHILRTEPTITELTDTPPDENTSSKYRATFFISSRQIPFSCPSPLSLQSLQACKDCLNQWRNIPEWSISCKSSTKRIVPPPLPLTTARLLQQYTHLSPHTVMELCQILYQEGHITYMRTDNAKYSPEFLEKCKLFLKSTYDMVDGFTLNEKLSTAGQQAAHEAIRVTDLNKRSIICKEAKANALYQFIWRTTVQSCMPDAEIEDHCWVLHPVEANHKIEFPKTYGWLQVEHSKEYFQEWTQKSSGTELFLRQWVPKKPEKISLEEIVDRPPKHYSESGLISELEKRGIGRPSTFATLVRTLLDRGYVQKTDIEGVKYTCHDFFWISADNTIQEKNRIISLGNEKAKLVIQPIGLLVSKFLLEHFQVLMSYDYTSEMELALDQVSDSLDSQFAYETLCEKCDGELKSWIKPLQKKTKQAATHVKDSTDGSEYEYKITPKGGYLRNCNTGECKALKDSLQLNRLEINQDTDAADLLEFPGQTDILGELEGKPVKFSKSSFGWFLKWGEDDVVKIPEEEKKRLHSITLAQVSEWAGIGHIDGNERLPPPPPGCLRIINKILSIRKGKYGPYLFQADTKKCFALRKFPGDFLHCPEEDLWEFIQSENAKKKKV